MTPDQTFARPDPGAGQRGDAAYADHWTKSHETVSDPLGYRAGYIDVLALDALLPEGYRLLDIGCGTAGYHRLLTRHGHVHGVDFMPEMIEAAEKFKRDFGIRNAQYTCASFEDFEDSSGYDAVRMPGVYGWYRPWHGQQRIMDRISTLLNPSGIAVLSYVPPTTATMLAKTILAPERTVIIRRSHFERMVRHAAMTALFDIKLPHVTMVFVRKVAAG